MMLSSWKRGATAASIILLLAAASPAHAQTAEPRWNVEVGVGWDNGISGNINSSGVGQINNQTVVITQNSYEDVYGTGLHLRFGGGFMLNQDTEVRGTFTFQSLDADQVVRMGDIGVSNLYGQYTDYQTFGLDVGLRKYLGLTQTVRAYGEGTVGLGFVDKTDVTLVAPGANLSGKSNDFYDQTAAFTFGAAVGVLLQGAGHVGFFGQMGLRWVSGMSQIDDLASTGLGDINNKSSRWTLPFIGGVRLRF